MMEVLITPHIIHLQASSHNDAGQYERANQCGQMALCCNICVIIKYVLMLIIAVILVVLFFTGVLAFTTAATNCLPSCTTDIYGDVNCQTVVRVCT
jgi:hypothetical protein